MEKVREGFTRYEVARILGARSLQLAMDAPVLLKISKEEEEELNFDSLKTAEKEFEKEVLPITVKRPLPQKSEKTVKKLSDEEIKEKLEKKAEEEEKKVKIEKKKEKIEEAEEKEIVKEGEIMEMAKPEDEAEEEPQAKPEGAEI